VVGGEHKVTALQTRFEVSVGAVVSYSLAAQTRNDEQMRLLVAVEASDWNSRAEHIRTEEQSRLEVGVEAKVSYSVLLQTRRERHSRLFDGPGATDWNSPPLHVVS